MDPIPSVIAAAFPAREQQITQLYNLYGHKCEPFVDAVYVFGCTSTGKTSIVQSLLEKLELKHTLVNLVECYSAKVLLEKILNILSGHKVDSRNAQPYARCDNVLDFIEHVQRLVRIEDIDRMVIVLDKAEQLRSMDNNILPTFMKLRELTGVEVSVILISELPFEKFYGFSHYEPVKIFFPQYTREELLEILMQDYSYSTEAILKNSNDTDFLTRDFYRGYLNVFLSVFHRNCKDLTELRHNARLNFVPYCRPIFQKYCAANDSMALWRSITPNLKSSLEVLYLRIPNKGQAQQEKQLTSTLELPFYAKYLLIAAYLASYNSPKDDKRLFMKYHGKKRKSKKDLNKKNKVSERLSTQVGPKAFTLDRLMVILYAILDEKVGFNHNLLVQVTSLVELQLLLLVSESAGIDGHKYKCNVGYDFIESISKMGFSVAVDVKRFVGCCCCQYLVPQTTRLALLGL